jgi:hypothetical protein
MGVPLMSTVIALNAESLYGLDLTPATHAIAPFILTISTESDPQISFDLQLPNDPDDPRELSEIPEIRLWFIRLDATYPWLPFWLNWKEGELARYTAMLVPHQFHPTAGIQYNPEALEIFLMQKLFTISAWLKQHHVNGHEKLKNMAKLLGYELDDGLFTIL